jgi:hypothetical protein
MLLYIKPSLERSERGNDTYMVESFFLHDWKPLVPHEIERGLKLLAWSRAELLSLVQELSDEKLSQTYLDERWPIRGILKHIGSAEWWYQERIGYPCPENEAGVPSEAFERLEIVRDHFTILLPKLDGVHKVVGLDRRSGVRAKRCSVRRGLARKGSYRAYPQITWVSYYLVGEIPMRSLISSRVK